MTNYCKVKSNFIKEKLKKTSFEDRGYIDDLMFLEQSILKEIYGWLANMRLFGLKNKYKKEYEIIFKEIAPAKYKRTIQQEKKEAEKERKEEEKWQKEEEEEEKRERKSWEEARKVGIETLKTHKFL